MIMKVSLMVFAIFFFLYAGMASYYLRTLRSVPDVAGGAVYPLGIHGWVVYLDQPRHFLLRILEAVQVICAAIFAVARILTLRHQSPWDS
jgi:hypothetical protein